MNALRAYAVLHARDVKAVAQLVSVPPSTGSTIPVT